MPYRAPGSTGSKRNHLAGRPIRYYRPKGSPEIRTLIDEGFQAFNAARPAESCRIYSDKMLSPDHDTTIALTVAGALTPAGLGGAMIELMERGLVDFLISTGANLWAALEIAKRPQNKGKFIVTVACSTGERYLSPLPAAEARADRTGEVTPN